MISIAIDPSVNRPMINRKDMPTTHSHFDTVEVSRFESLIGYLQKFIIDNLVDLVALPVEQSHLISLGNGSFYNQDCQQSLFYYISH